MKSLFAAAALTASLALTAPMAAVAGSGDAAQAGYVDFSALTAHYGEPRVMVNLGGSLLQLAAAMEHEDPAADRALQSLDSVRIHVYSTGGDTDTAEARMEDAREKLLPEDWEPIVRVREDGESVDIYASQKGERIQGLVIMAVDGEEAVFINVLGDIDPKEISGIARHMDIDVDVDL